MRKSHFASVGPSWCSFEEFLFSEKANESETRIVLFHYEHHEDRKLAFLSNKAMHALNGNTAPKQPAIKYQFENANSWTPDEIDALIEYAEKKEIIGDYRRLDPDEQDQYFGRAPPSCPGQTRRFNEVLYCIREPQKSRDPSSQTFGCTRELLNFMEEKGLDIREFSRNESGGRRDIVIPQLVYRWTNNYRKLQQGLSISHLWHGDEVIRDHSIESVLLYLCQEDPYLNLYGRRACKFEGSYRGDDPFRQCNHLPFCWGCHIRADYSPPIIRKVQELQNQSLSQWFDEGSRLHF